MLSVRPIGDPSTTGPGAAGKREAAPNAMPEATPDTSASTTPETADSRIGALAVLALAGAAIAAYWPILVWNPLDEIRGFDSALEGWFYSTLGGAPGLVLALAAWLAWNRRNHWLRVDPDHPPSTAARAWAIPFALPALGLHLWSTYVGAPELLVPGASLAFLALGAGMNGLAGARAILPVAAFALLAHPLPVALVNAVVFPMQRLTAHWASANLDWFGISHVQIGDRLETTRAHFQVIETCAGLRSMQTLVMGSVLYVELFYRSRTQALWLIGLSPVVALLLNHLRVLTILFNPYSEIATLHALQGMVVLFFGIFAIAGLDRLHARWSGGSVRRSRRRAIAPGARIESAAVGTAALLLVALAAGVAAMPEWRTPRPLSPPPSALPGRLDDWRPRNLPLDDVFLGSARPSRWLHRRYVREEGSEPVDVQILEDDRRHRFHDILSEKTAVIGTGWEIRRREAHRFGEGGYRRDVELLEQRSATGSALALHWRRGFDPTWLEIARSALVLDRGPWRRRGRSFAIRVATPYDDTPEGREKALARLEEVASLVQRALWERNLKL